MYSCPHVQVPKQMKKKHEGAFAPPKFVTATSENRGVDKFVRGAGDEPQKLAPPPWKIATVLQRPQLQRWGGSVYEMLCVRVNPARTVRC